MQILLQTVLIRIITLPTLSDYFQLGLIYLNAQASLNGTNLEDEAKFLEHGIAIIEEIY